MEFGTNYNSTITTSPNSRFSFWGLGEAAKINGVKQAHGAESYKAVSANFGDVPTNHPTRADWYNADALLGMPSSKGQVCPQVFDCIA